MSIQVTKFYSSESINDCPQLNHPEYALIGRSNVGKSSLINLIANHKIAYTSSKPGKTQLINHIVINNNWSLVDLPGYGYAKISKLKREKILKNTETYFKKRGITLVAVFILIDIRIPAQKIDLDRMKWLVQHNIFFIRVFTKCDGIRKSDVAGMIKKYDKCMSENHWSKIPETIITSSKNKIGADLILERIHELNNLFQNI